VAPSFHHGPGYSLVISHLPGPTNTLRPFWPDTARRLGFILLCAYALHAPGLTAADWTVLNTTQKARELFKVDVLQCIVFSLLIFQGLARLVRSPRVFNLPRLVIAIFVPLVSPHLWAHGVADGMWLPIRGLFNGNSDRGLNALFPLFPGASPSRPSAPSWAASTGTCGWGTRRRARPGGVNPNFLVGLAVVGAVLLAWGHLPPARPGSGAASGSRRTASGVLASPTGAFTYGELGAIANTTLPSVAGRAGWILLGGSLMGAIELVRPKGHGANPVKAASAESLLLYMLHLTSSSACCWPRRSSPSRVWAGAAWAGRVRCS